MTENPHGDRGREQDIQDVLAAYYENAETENDPDRRILLDRHPRLAAELAEFFAMQDELNQLARPLGAKVFQGSDVANGNERDQFHPIRLLFSGPHSTHLAVEESILFGDYELQGVIARGGMGVVFRARQRSLNRLVALKVIRDGARASTDDARRFRNEAEAVAHLDHPHIVPIHEVGEVGGCSFFSMKLVEGGNLAERLQEYQSDQRAAARLVASVARAIHHAHERGILHRDLKPSNILIDRQGQPLVADFGLARRVEADSELTQTGAVLGTPAYMAPEQATGRKGTVTKAADIHGLGAVLYAILTGRAPFQGETPLETLQQVQERVPEPPSAVRQFIDRDLETICLKCLEKEPGRRYASALAVAEDLERWRAGRAILARPVGLVDRAWRWCRRNRRASAVSAALVVLALTSVVGLALGQRASETAFLLDREIRRTEQARRSRQYVQAVKHASQLWGNNMPGQALDLLERDPPGPAEEDLRGFAWHYCHRLFSIRAETLKGHQGDVYFARFSPDGKTLATASKDKTVRIWDSQTRTTRLILEGHGDEVNWVSFSPDGRMIATASDDQRVKLWHAATGRAQSTLTGHREEVVAAIFTPDGQRLISCDRKGTVILWDVALARECSFFEVKNGRIQCLAISPDGATLAIAGERLLIWSLIEGKPRTWIDGAGQMPWYNRPFGQVNGVAFSRDGHLMATASLHNDCQFWETRNWQRAAGSSESQEDLESVTFSPDDHTLASVSTSGIVHLLDRGTRAKVDIASGQDRLWCVAFSPDGQRLATTSKDGTVKLWDTVSQPMRAATTVGTIGNPSIAFSVDGKTLALADDRGAVWTIDSCTVAPVGTMRFQAEGNIQRAALSQHGRALATVNDAGVITHWDVWSGHRIQNVAGPTPPGPILAISPEGAWIARTGQHGVVDIWRPDSGLQSRIPGASGRSLLFCPGRDTLSIWDSDSTRPCLYDLPAGKPRIARGPAHSSRMTAQAYSLDGASLATAGAEGTIIIWDVATLEQLIQFYSHADAVTSLAFSRDARTLASGSHAGIVRLWDLASGTELLALVRHSGPVRQVSFSADGLTLATIASVEGAGTEVFLWRAQPRKDAGIRP